MNDSQRSFEIGRLIEEAKRHGPQHLETALQMAEEIEDTDDKSSYIAIIAETLATIGTLTDLERALQLGRTTKAIDKWVFAFRGVFARLMAENDIDRALEIVGELELIAVKFETDDDYDNLTRSEIWDDIGDMYEKAGKIEHTRQKWANAVRWAQAGQNSSKIQEAVDCHKVLTRIARKFLKAGYAEDAINTAHSITHGGFRNSALTAIADWQSKPENK